MNSKVALVTGGARGIGKAISLRLAKDGFMVGINAYHENTVNAAVAEVEKMGKTALALPGDVSDAQTVKDMFDRLLREFGKLDVLVTNAGVSEVNTLDELNEEIWEHTLAVNGKGTYLCILEASKHMIDQKSGKIITIGSDYAIQGSRYNICYSASKFAVRGMTQSFAKALAEYNITVNCVNPGIIWTEMWESADEKLSKVFGMKRGEAFKKFSDDVVLLPKIGKPEYVAPVVSFLASEDADYITAATIPVGGGSMIF